MIGKLANGILSLSSLLWFRPVTDRIKCRLPGSDQANAPLGNPIAFFTALQIISREKGFWRKSNIRNFSALDATALASYPDIRMIGASLPFDRIRSATSSPEPSGNLSSVTIKRFLLDGSESIGDRLAGLDLIFFITNRSHPAHFGNFAELSPGRGSRQTADFPRGFISEIFRSDQRSSLKAVHIVLVRAVAERYHGGNIHRWKVR
jgi:hypothetical protein